MSKLRTIILVLALMTLLLGIAGLIHAAGPNQPPIAFFTYSPDNPTPQESILFDASGSYAPSGRIVQYAWDFGDGTVSTLTDPSITHSYPVDGDYTVQLTVTDNNGYTGTAVAIVQIRCVVFFRVVILGQPQMPVGNVKVTAYYKSGSAWVKIPASYNGVEIKYDNMTQPNLASTSAQKYRNPGYTAAILRANASNIGFDLHSSDQEVFFKIEWGSYIAYWPNETTRVYSYKSNGIVETHDYNIGHQAHWDPSAQTYVIKTSHISDDGVSPTEGHPIIVGINCPPPTTNYYLTVNTSPPGITTIPGQGSYIANMNVTLTAPTYVNVSTNTRYRFNYWDVDGTSRGNGVNPITIFMNANHTATAHYVTQYSATFNQTGLSSDATGTIMTVNGVTETFTQLPYTLWADSGSSVTYSYTSVVPSSVSGKQYRLNTVSGPTSPISVTGATTVTGNYVTQYLVTFAQTGLDSTANGTIVIVNGTSKTYLQLPYSFWVDSGSSVTYSYSSPASSSTAGKQFRLNGVFCPSSPITVTGPVTVTGDYCVQYLVTFAQTGLDSTASGTIVTVNGGPKIFSTLPYTSWFDAGSSITYSYTSIVSSSVSGKQFRLNSVTGTSSPITVTGSATITGNYVAQYQVSFAQTGLDSSATGTGVTVNSATKAYGDLTYTLWVDSGGSVTYTYNSIVTSSVSGKQFRLLSVTGPSSPITVTGPTNIIGNYKIQYFLTVTSPYDSPTPVSGWFDSGSSITESVTSPAPGPTGTQYVCTGWTGSGSVPASGTASSVTFTIIAPSSIVWNWKTQYYLTVTSAYDSPTPVSGWFDSGSSVTDSVTSPVSGPSGTRYVCTGWTGTGSVPGSGSALSVTFTIAQPSSIVWNWKTQYQVTFSQSGVGTDFAGTVVTIDTVNYGVSGLPVVFWWDSGSSHNFSFASPLTVGSKQYVWNSTSGLSTSQGGTLTVTASGSVVGNYIIQNQVTFDQVGVSSDFAGTVVIIDSVSYSKAQLPISFSWSMSSTHSFAFQSPLMVGANAKQYVWTNTTGLSTLQSGSITVTTYGSIIGNYKTQYYLTVTSPYDSPSPVSGWFDSGTSVTESVTSPVSGGSGTQYVCSGWTGSGSVPASGSVSSVTFTINAPSSIVWTWKTQYFLTVTSPYDSPSPVSGWFDSGSSITDSVTSPVSGPSGTRYVCTGWTGTGSVPASGSASSVTFAIIAPSTIAWTWKTQYYLTVTSPYGTAGGQGWYDSASTAYAALNTGAIDQGNGTRRVFTNWNVDASGTNYAQSDQIVMNGQKTAAANWKTQYYVTFAQTGLDSSASGTVLTVNGNPVTFGALPYSLWVDSSGTVTYSFNNVSSSTSGKQFILIGVTGQTSPITVTSPTSATGNYVTQYQITFNQTGVGNDFTGSIVTVDSTGYTYSTLPVSFWWDSSSSHAFSFSSPLPVNISKQYNWVSTTGLATVQNGVLNVADSGNVIGNYAVENKYCVTFDQTGVGTDYSGTVVVVDGTDYPVLQLPVSLWFDINSVHTFAYQSPLTVSPNGKQYVWTSTTGLSNSQSGAITVTGSGSVVGNYKTQYYLSLDTNPLGITTPSGAGWYDAGTNASISTVAYVDIVPGTSRYRFSGWTTTNIAEIADPNRSPTTVLMDEGKTVTANYAVQYKITLNQTGVSTDFASGIVTIDGLDFNGSALPVSFMWDKDSIHTFSYYSPLIVNPTKQYVWTYTSGLSTLQAGSITVSASGSVTGNYVEKLTYTLTIATTTGGITNPAIGPHIYQGGTTVQVTAIADPGFQLDHWELDGSYFGAANPYSILINQDHTLKAFFKPVPSVFSAIINPTSGSIQVGESLTFNSIVNGGVPPYSNYQWYLDNMPVQGATSSSWTYTPQHASTHFVYLKVTDSNSTTIQSNAAVINVSSIPIGGYSISFAKPSPLSNIAAYMAIVALSSAILSSKKRKRK